MAKKRTFYFQQVNNQKLHIVNSQLHATKHQRMYFLY
jgi:hypothetical protein